MSGPAKHGNDAVKGRDRLVLTPLVFNLPGGTLTRKIH